MHQQHASREKEKGRAQGKQSRVDTRQKPKVSRDCLLSTQFKASSIRQKGTTEGAQQKALKPRKTALQLVQCTVCASKTSSLR